MAMKQQIWLAQDKHLLFHQHTLPVFLARKKETNTGIYSIFFPEKRGPDRQSCSFFLFILLLCSFHSSLAMIIAPGKTLLAQWGELTVAQRLQFFSSNCLGAWF